MNWVKQQQQLGKSLANQIERRPLLGREKFYFWKSKWHDIEMLTCKLSPPMCACGGGCPSLCRCVRDCSAFTFKIIAVSKRLTPTTQIWRAPRPRPYRWQFDDCISCMFFVAHALGFLINTIFTLLLYWFMRLIVSMYVKRAKEALRRRLFSYLLWYVTADSVQRLRSSKFDADNNNNSNQMTTTTITMLQTKIQLLSQRRANTQKKIRAHKFHTDL